MTKTIIVLTFDSTSGDEDDARSALIALMDYARDSKMCDIGVLNEELSNYYIGSECERFDPLLGYQKGAIIMPALTDEQLEEMKEGIIAAMERTSAVPIVALPPDIRVSKVTDKTRTAEEYREDGYEDLAKQKEEEEKIKRAKDAALVADAVMRKEVKE